jgi:hypothetical protein
MFLLLFVLVVGGGNVAYYYEFRRWLFLHTYVYFI